MYALFVTKSSAFLIGPIATLLGYLMNAIFEMLNTMGIPNIGTSVILFTIIINLLMLPLTIKQQRSTKLNSVIQPEVQAVQAKYKDRKDQESMVKMNDEVKAVYAKYGTSMTGGCLTSLIQIPVLFALYQVIYRLPAYVDSVKGVLMNIVNALQTSYPDYATVEEFTALAGRTVTGDFTQANKVVDLLYSLNSTKWTTFTELFPNIANVVAENRAQLSVYNTFLGMDLAQNPGFAFPIILIPILAGLLQWLSVKLSTATMEQPKGDNPTMNTMNTMNNIMPLMSVVFCFMLPAGVGLYWVASSGVRVIIQLFVNQYIKNLDMDKVVEQNVARLNAKRAKQGLPPVKATKVSEAVQAMQESKEEREAKEAAIAEADRARVARQKAKEDFYNDGEANPTSLAARAAMVEKYNRKAEEKGHKK